MSIFDYAVSLMKVTLEEQKHHSIYLFFAISDHVDLMVLPQL